MIVLTWVIFIGIIVSVVKSFKDYYYNNDNWHDQEEEGGKCSDEDND